MAANYAALQSAWASTTLPAGVTGTALLAGDTAAQKLTKMNAWTVVGAAIPMIVPSYMIYDCIVPSEFSAASAANQQLVRDIVSQGTVNGASGHTARTVMLNVFGAGSTTRANLVTLAANYDSPVVPWWQSIGFTAPLGTADLTIAGLS